MTELWMAQEPEGVDGMDAMNTMDAGKADEVIEQTGDGAVGDGDGTSPSDGRRDVAPPLAADDDVAPPLAADDVATDIATLDDEGEAEEASDEWPTDLDEDERMIIEGLVFASDEPIPFKQIRDILYPASEDETIAAPTDAADGEEESTPRTRRATGRKAFTVNRLQAQVAALNAQYAEGGRAFRIAEIAGGFAFQTTASVGGYVGRMFAERTKRRLTQSALETLAIISFRQPISKPAIEAIRGVNADYVLKSLLDRNLIAIVGRDNSVGRPLLYGTTKTFLKHFGLNSLEDLPKPREIADLLAEENDLAARAIEESDERPALGDGSEPSIFDTLRSTEGVSPGDGAEATEPAPTVEGAHTAPTTGDLDIALDVEIALGQGTPTAAGMIDEPMNFDDESVDEDDDETDQETDTHEEDGSAQANGLDDTDEEDVDEEELDDEGGFDDTDEEDVDEEELDDEDGFDDADEEDVDEEGLDDEDGFDDADEEDVDEEESDDKVGGRFDAAQVDDAGDAAGAAPTVDENVDPRG
jgi:segregation and condensation protein B